MSKSPLIILGLVIALVGGKYIYTVATQPDDKTQIRQTLAEAIKASKEGRPGSVIEKLTDNFKINGSQPGLNQIANLVRQSHPDIAVKDTDPVVSNDTAQITSDVSVSAKALGSYSFKDVVLVFRKESGTDWLIFPTTHWHLSAARVRPEDLPTSEMP